MPISLVRGQLIGVLVECLFYGMYVVVFAQSLRVFYYRHKEGRNTLWLFGLSFIIFVLITVYLAIDFVRVTTAFTENTNVPNASLAYYDHIPLAQRFTRILTYMLLTLVTDAIIVYRTYVVWGRNPYVIVVPSLLVLTDTGFTAWVLVSLMQHSGPVALSTSYAQHVRYFYSVTLAANLISSILISWKIWSTHRSVGEPAVAGVRFLGVMAVILESAAVYSCLLIVLIITSVTRSYSTWIVLNSICPAIGMIFSTVMVRSSREYHTNTFFTNDLAISSSLNTEPVIPLHQLPSARAVTRVTTPPAPTSTFRISFDACHVPSTISTQKTDIESGHTDSHTERSPAGQAEHVLI